MRPVIGILLSLTSEGRYWSDFGDHTISILTFPYAVNKYSRKAEYRAVFLNRLDAYPRTIWLMCVYDGYDISTSIDQRDILIAVVGLRSKRLQSESITLSLWEYTAVGLIDSPLQDYILLYRISMSRQINQRWSGHTTSFEARVELRGAHNLWWKNNRIPMMWLPGRAYPGSWESSGRRPQPKLNSTNHNTAIYWNRKWNLVEIRAFRELTVTLRNTWSPG